MVFLMQHRKVVVHNFILLCVRTESEMLQFPQTGLT